MQLSSIQSTLSWLLLPVLALAATPSSGGLTKVGTGQLNLLTPQHLDTTTLGRAVYCKNEDPYQFTSSRNYTFPDTPAISQSEMVNAGFDPNDGGEYPFDCFMELPGGYVVFEIKGDLDSHLRLVFQVWISVLVFNYDIGVYSCDLLNFEKDPCAFNIDKKYFVGQGGLFPENDPDPDFWDLCLEVHGVVKVPYTRIQKKVDFKKCFNRFPRNEVAAPTIPVEAASKFR